ncbi:hypothetical protein D3C78_1027700 [compost metagenome]
MLTSKSPIGLFTVSAAAKLLTVTALAAEMARVSFLSMVICPYGPTRNRVLGFFSVVLSLSGADLPYAYGLPTL